MQKLHWTSITKFRFAGITYKTVKLEGDIALPELNQPRQLFDRNGEELIIQLQEVRQNGKQS